MRPDVISWRHTDTMKAIEFSPRTVLASRVPAWLLLASCLQGLAALACWWGLTLLPTPGPAPERTWLSWLSFCRAVVLENPVALVVVSQFAGLLIVALIIAPLVRRAIHVHTKSLRALFEAIQGLASGATPTPLPAGGPGEAGYLSIAFNDMAAKLATSRRELIAANEMLEQRVEERTRELRQACDKMEVMASTDALSGLPNRRCMRDQLPRIFEEAADRSDDLIFLAIDLDGFKGVNDALGHQVGDQVIRLAADTLRDCCRSKDLMARLGGDEFLVVLRGITHREAGGVAERIQNQFLRRISEALTNTSLPQTPSMSIGISSLRSNTPKSVDDLLAQADSALYAAKRSGKGRAEFFTPRAA